MKNAHKAILAVFFLALFSSIVLGIGFEISGNIIKDDVAPNEAAIIELTIKNNAEIEERYRFAVSDFTLWSIDTEPQEYRLSGIDVPAGESKTFNVFIYPTKKVIPERYTVVYSVKGEKSNEELKNKVNINVKTTGPLIPEYEPKIKVEIEVPDKGKIDPRKDNIIKVSLKNRNVLDLSDIHLNVKSSLFEEEKKTISLSPLELKIIEIPVTIDSKWPPKKDTVVATATSGNKTFVALEDFSIIAYTEPFDVKKEFIDKFLKNTEVITLTNIANSKSSEIYKVKIPFFKKIVTSTKPKAEKIKDDAGSFRGWKIELEPQKSFTINITTNYRPLVIIIIITLISIILYYVLRSDIIVTKTAANIKTRDEGVSGFKIVLHLKNRSSNSYEKIEIIDKVPHIAEFEREINIGTIEPQNVVMHEKKGTIVRWDIDSLDGYEERIISYKVKSKLSVLGSFYLPLAKVRYKDKKGNIIVSKSNLLKIGS